jgi:dihydrofolate synthase/folylpolyglutamate synthase
LAALWIFREAHLDVAVLEVGLGGRLDAFNVVDCEIAIITSIGIDHVEYLGSDLQGIGSEKAGVMRRDQFVVLGRDLPESVGDRAAELATTVVGLDREIVLALGGDHWSVAIGPLCFADLPLPRLPVANCALAIAAATRLVDLDAERLAAALTNVWMPGRLEAVDVCGRRWLLDVAHNPHGAAFLARELASRGLHRVIAVYGALQDKDARGVVAELIGQVDQWVLTATTGARGSSSDQVATRSGLIDARRADAVEDALRIAGSLADPADVILVFGSFAVVERARLALERWPQA